MTKLNKRGNIIKEYYKQVYANKLYNLDKMEKFIERYKLSKLTQEEVGNLTGLVIKISK